MGRGGGKTGSFAWMGICYPFKKKKKALSESENETQSMDNVLKQVCTGINAAKANVICLIT